MKQIARVFLLCAVAITAQAEVRDLGNGIRLEGQFTQGGLVVGSAPAGTRLTFQKRALPISQDGTFVLGFNRDDASPQTLQVTLPGQPAAKLVLAIASREFDVQKITGVPARTVNPDPADMERIQKEQAAVGSAREVVSKNTYFTEHFQWPVKGPVTGVYGSQRIYNGEPRSPHFGVDLAVPHGTTIVAPADGVVSMAYPDMFFSGDTIVIDHGMGINTTYLHMSKMLVKKGDAVKQGQPIGKVGASGRATGPHLCWRLNWFQSRLDPQLIMATPKPE